MSLFKPARRRESRIRMALLGPAGSGKTFTALRIAHGLVGTDQRVAVIDTEHASSNLYADEANPDGGGFDFDVLDLAAMPGSGRYSIEKYLTALRMAANEGYPVLVIDSLSHAWAGEGGLLDYVDQQAAKSKNNSFAGWRKGTPLHNRFVQALLDYPGHVIGTMRTKVEWLVEQREVRGKMQNVPVKVGMQPVQRADLDYEFTVVGDIDLETHTLSIGKTRCSALADRTFPKAGADVAAVLRDWIDGAAPESELPEWFIAVCNADRVSPDEALAAFATKGWGHPADWDEIRQGRFTESRSRVWTTLGLSNSPQASIPSLPPAEA